MCGVDGTTYQNSCFSGCSLGKQKRAIRHRGRCVGTNGTKGAKEWNQCVEVANWKHGANTHKWVVIYFFLNVQICVIKYSIIDYECHDSVEGAVNAMAGITSQAH